MMRIIGGKHKGRKLYPPKNLKARPTMDITKESLFNALKNDYFFNEIRVMDLFAGTGNISLEFASRGAERVLAVDRQAASVRFIEKKAREWDLPVETLQADVKEWVIQPASQSFEVVFMDPPYALSVEEFRRIIDAVLDNGWLAPGGTLVVEHPKGMSFDAHPRLAKTRRYGHSMLSFFK